MKLLKLVHQHISCSLSSHKYFAGDELLCAPSSSPNCRRVMQKGLLKHRMVGRMFTSSGLPLLSKDVSGMGGKVYRAGIKSDFSTTQLDADILTLYPNVLIK